MKGLLLKDWYMIQKYCRSYILITAVLLGYPLQMVRICFLHSIPVCCVV